MYGWICGCIEDLVITTYGAEVWDLILGRSGVEVGKGEFFHSVDFSDSIVHSLLECSSDVLRTPLKDLLFAFGEHFVTYIFKHGLGKILLGNSRSAREWLHSIGEPHRVMRIKFPNANLPEFRVEENECGFQLHYYSSRGEYWEPMIEGLCCKMAFSYFDQQISMNIILSEELESSHHSCWLVSNLDSQVPPLVNHSPETSNYNINCATTNDSGNFPIQDEPKCPFHAAFSNHPDEIKQNPDCADAPTIARSSSAAEGIGMNANHFQKVFPFHVSIDKNFKIVQLGNKIEDMFRQQDVQLLGKDISSVFKLSPEGYEWSWDCLRLIEGKIISLVYTQIQPALRFSGEVIIQDDGYAVPSISFLIRPDIYRIADMEGLNLTFGDFPMHSFQRDIIVAGETLKEEINNANRMTEMSRELSRQSTIVKQALKTKQVFVRYVSHEIRTPLNIAVLGVGYLEDKLDIAELAKPGISDTIDEIKVSCSIAVEILNDFLLYEKMDDGIFDLSLNRTPFVPIIEECKKLFDIQAKSAHIIFEVDIDPQLSHADVLIDRKKFYQVLRNLLSNAIKFTPENGTVSLSATLIDNDQRHIAVVQTLVAADDDAVTEDVDHTTAIDDNMGSMLHRTAASTATTSFDWQHLHGQKIYFVEDLPVTNVPRNAEESFTRRSSSADQVNLMKSFNLSSQSDATDSSALPPPPPPPPISPRDNSSVTSGFSTGNVDVPQIEECARYVRLVVSDSGPGISVADQVSLFHQFIQVQADKLQQGQGSGLGLWIAANIMRKHGGRIGVMSAGEEKGSHFVVDLPIFTPQPSALVASQPPLQPQQQQLLLQQQQRSRAPSMSYPHAFPPPAGSPRAATSHMSAVNSYNPAATTTTTATTTATGSSASNDDFDSPSLAISRVSTTEMPLFGSAGNHHTHVRSSHPQQFSNIPELTLSSLTTHPGHPSLLLSSPSAPSSAFSSSIIRSFEEEMRYQSMRTLPLRHARVLIVDDAISNRKMMRKILQDTFTAVIEEAENGKVAVDRYAASFGTAAAATAAQDDKLPYDIIFMDGIMPVMDGLQATTEIRKFQYQRIQQQVQQQQQQQDEGPRNVSTNNHNNNDHNDHNEQKNYPQIRNPVQIPLLPIPSSTTTTTSAEAAAVAAEAAVAAAPPARFHRTLILGVTGNGQDEDMKRFLDAGADHVFVKPIQIASLMEFLDMFFLST